uniref:proton-coupled folate transporter-like isoform X1 n=1 Tax=Styela clava TaxID=7725 RepID=UPI001939FC93|nr:proton-coupled folate transporter-like isoform X1 [Styela clava]
MGRFPIIETITFFASATFYTLHTIENEYIYQMVSESHNFTSNHSVKYCEEVDNVTQVSDNEQVIADGASKWSMYTKIVLYTSNAISSLIITAWSDSIGRKRALVFPLLGCLLSSTMQALIILFRLPLHFVVINALSYGLSGGYSTMIDVGTAYLSDTVQTEKRGRRYTILEVTSSLGGGLALMGTGYWIKYRGFVPSSFLLVGCSIVALILLPFLKTNKPGSHKLAAIEEVVQLKSEKLSVVGDETECTITEEKLDKNENSKQKPSGWIQIKEVKRIYSSDYSKCDICDDTTVNGKSLSECAHGGGYREGRVWRLWFYLMAFVTYMFVMNGIDIFQTMYFVSSPICFTPELVGVQNGIDACTIIFSPFIVIFYESILHMNSQTMLLTSITGRLLTSLLMFFANGATLVFVATSIGVFSSITTPYIRLRISSLVSTSEQGPALALVSFATEIINASSVVFLVIYPSTLYISHGFTWLVTASILCCPLTLMIIVWITNKYGKNAPT